MVGSSVTSCEAERLSALVDLQILDSPPEREFDELTRLAASALGVASAAISLIDDRRQWFKARQGIPFEETPREIAFCAHAVEAQRLLLVPDARLDPRFAQNPLVAAEGGIRFYVGMPLILQSGHCIGTLCAFDPEPRDDLTPAQLGVLGDLASLAVDLIESRRFRRMGEIAAKVVDATSDAVLAADRTGKIVYWNLAAEGMFGHAVDVALGQDVALIIPPRLAAGHREIFARAAAGGETRLVGSFVELVGARADGEEFPVELSLARWGDPDGDGGFAAIVRDITSRKALEREREQAVAFLDNVIVNLPAMLFVKDTDTRSYVMVNRKGEAVMGRPASEIVGATDKELFPTFGAAYEDRDTEVIEGAQARIFESEFVREDGEHIHLRTTRTLIDGPDRPGQYILGISEDVSETRRAEAEVRRLAQFDTLTGLLNRGSYSDRLRRTVEGGEPFAMLSIDLDRFKAVNDQFGHPAGDTVLGEVGERLRAIVGASGWSARVGGDEFVAVLIGGRLREHAGEVANAITSRLGQPYTTERATVHLGASIGVVLFPEDGGTTDQLREHADLALLRQALADEAITLRFKPTTDIRTGAVTAFEATPHWIDPALGEIAADRLFAVAQDIGVISELTTQLFRKACAEAAAWPPAVRLAFPVTAAQLRATTFGVHLLGTLGASGLSPTRLDLEIDEGALIRDTEGVRPILEPLRAAGISVVASHFGTGYSDLQNLHRLRLDRIKIDPSFVAAMLHDRQAATMVKALIGVGKSMDIAVAADGVGSLELQSALAREGCQEIQGGSAAAPLDADEARSLAAASDAPTKAPGRASRPPRRSPRSV